MNNNCALGFIKKDLNLFINIIFIVLSSLSGGTIIFSLLKLNGDFRVDNIYAMYAFVAKLIVMFLPVVIWGVEFKSGTINLLQISNKNMVTICFYKFVTYLIDIFTIMFISYLEVMCYVKIAHVDMQAMELLKSMAEGYFLYGAFYFGLSCVIVFLFKDMTKSLIAVLLIYFCGNLGCNLIAHMSTTAYKIVEIIPFSYAEDAFSFANFTGKQAINIGIYAVILNIVAIALAKKRGVV